MQSHPHNTHLQSHQNHNNNCDRFHNKMYNNIYFTHIMCWLPFYYRTQKKKRASFVFVSFRYSNIKILDTMSSTIQSKPVNNPSPVTAEHATIFQCLCAPIFLVVVAALLLSLVLSLLSLFVVSVGACCWARPNTWLICSEFSAPM